MATDYATIVVRRGNADAWENSQRPLASGEWGYDETSRVIKIGDGYTMWPDLASAITAGVTGQLPDDVREALAANLADPETAEGAAIATTAADAAKEAASEATSAATISTDADGTPVLQIGV
ncbi:hypothetical protein [Curtobacterium sp. 18060]|uniref:hypothetical protein n=1 Tax=Curtobacterium sp. 18060 TaxID=2681408 RepID=UPI001357DE9F|nr:hypothetical protein [Curtobacterium sp. 18060]